MVRVLHAEWSPADSAVKVAVLSTTPACGRQRSSKAATAATVAVAVATRPAFDCVSLLHTERGVPPAGVSVAIVAAHQLEERCERFVRLVERLADLGLVVINHTVCSGPLLSRTRCLVGQSRVFDRFVLTGSVLHVRAAYCATDIAMLVSGSETIPRCLIEAQACGIPAACMGAGGVGETFDVGVTSVRHTQGDVPSMADGTVRLLECGGAGQDSPGYASGTPETRCCRVTGLRLTSAFCARSIPPRMSGPRHDSFLGSRRPRPGRARACHRRLVAG